MVNRRSALRSDYTLNCLIKVFIERHLLAHFPVIYCICVTSHVYMLSACSKATTALSIREGNEYIIRQTFIYKLPILQAFTSAQDMLIPQVPLVSLGSV